MRKTFFIFLASIILYSCSSGKTPRNTLRSIDIVGEQKSQHAAYMQPRSDDEIRKAYANYLKHASKDDRSRVTALNRLAQLEFELSEKILRDRNDTNRNELEALDDKLYNAKLDRTIELLNISIRDYPKAKHNDKSYYQLANAYYQKGDTDRTLTTLDTLIKKYPRSGYYIESQFRLAEAAFSKKEYALSEDRYTDIIGRKKNVVFYEKALYKRGWSRFKQEFYIEAVDDFVEVVKSNHYPEYQKLSSTDRNEFDEYFRAIALVFSYLGGAEPLNDYFIKTPGFPHLYHVYANLSDIYSKQERFTDAAQTLEAFAKHNPNSIHLPESYLKIVDVWKNAGFTNKVNVAVEKLYEKFHPDAQYWHKQKAANSRIYKLVNASLKKHILTVAANYHKEFETSKSISAFSNATKWYDNYLRHYRLQAHKDNIYFLYGSLLSLNGNYAAALYQYEQAAYDTDIILNKDSAYETIGLTSRLFKATTDSVARSTLLDKLITYSKRYTQQYPNDRNTASVIAYACESAYQAERHIDVIKLSENITASSSATLGSHINTIRAHSYLKLKQYKEAEETYLLALEQQKSNPTNRSQIYNSLALSIYYQGKTSADNGNIDEAIRNYTRINTIAPSSDLAVNGLYDSIVLAMKNELWEQAIPYIKKFQILYPNHKYGPDITRKLSVAYLNSKQHIEAAREFEKAAQSQQDREYSQTALWKAAELYESKHDINSAIRSYTQYSQSFPRPYPQYMESMYKLVSLYTQLNNEQQASHWRNQIIKADRKTPSSLKTDRTMLIASTASLNQAKSSHIKFSNIKLRLPLKTSLRQKKYAMQNAVNLYGRASSYGVAETATEATYSIAEIYRHFSKSLLDSERPRHLKGEELTQYQILLEDQAFPFEEKAIEFYETNLTHIRDGVYDEWVQKSHAQLKKLFPVRYNREVQLESYINVLH